MICRLLIVIIGFSIIIPMHSQGAVQDVLAESPLAVNNGDSRKVGSLLLPGDLKKYQDRVQNIIDNKNLHIMDDLGEVAYIKKNADLTIKKVIFSNGQVFDYLYSHDESGKLISCAISSGAVTITFTKSDDNRLNMTIVVNGDENNGTKGESHDIEPPPNEDAGGNEVPPSVDNVIPNLPPVDKPVQPQIVFYFRNDRIRLEDIATNPIKFNSFEIAKAVSKVAQQKDEAEKAYIKDTTSYYDQLAASILNNADGLKLNDSAEMNVIDKIGSNETPVLEKRAAVDEIVTMVYKRAQEGSVDKDVGDLIVLEKRLRFGILMPAKGIYDKKIESAVKYINGTIDRLLESNLAVYLNSKKDKIDVIINLPKVKNSKKVSQD